MSENIENANADKDIVNQGFIEQDTALESMRASDFDCYSAYGEVVDNSIQANATDIRIVFEEQKDRTNSRKKKIGRVLFADNGIGMDRDLLHKCLKLGHSSRYNDRSGIGRFGVGMTLGAIHECRRVEVYSKCPNDAWYYTYLDLDEIEEGALRYLPFPEKSEPQHEIVENIDESGTVVIWSKYDKQIEKYEKIITETKFWMGRTFRKFMWGEAEGYKKVTIKINGKRVNAFDPLFVNKTYSGFENEKKAELLEPQKLSWSIPMEVNSEKQKSQITINVSLLPEEYRRERGKGGDEYAKERFIDRNEGISILRNDREVFFDHIPHATALAGSEAKRMLNRFIGIEIAFSAELDAAFDVKNIKRGAVPVRELKNEIIERLAPTLRTYREKIQNEWNRIAREKEEVTSDKNAEIGISGSHSTTNSILSEVKKTTLRGDKAGKKGNDEKIAKKVKQNAKREEIEKIIEGLKENGITIDEKEFIGDTFIDIEHGNGFKTLFYNTNSTFYKSYKEILDEIKSKNEDIANDYRVLIDLIFVGYMVAESKIDPNEKMDGATFSNEIKSNWALSLSKILKQWKS